MHSESESLSSEQPVLMPALSAMPAITYIPVHRLLKTRSESVLPHISRGYDKYKARRKQSFTQELMDVTSKHRQIMRKRTNLLKASMNSTKTDIDVPEEDRSQPTAEGKGGRTEFRLSSQALKSQLPSKSATSDPKEKRVRTNLALLKAARGLGEVFSQSLLHAVLYQFQRYVEAILDEGRLLETLGELRGQRDQYKRSPLHYAAFLGQINACRSLLEGGWNLAMDTFGRTPLHYAALGNQAAIIELLLSKSDPLTYNLPLQAFPVAVNAQEDEEVARMLEAMTRYVGHTDTTPRFSKSALAIDAEDSAGKTSLHLAVLSNSFLAVQALCVAGADPLLSDSRGNRPVDLSANPKITQFLLKHINLSRTKLSQISYDVRDLELLSPLQINSCFIGPAKDTYLISAVAVGDKDAVKVLLEKGADFTVANRMKWTALHVMTRTNRLDLLQFVFEGKESSYKKPTLAPWTANLWTALDMTTKKGYNLLHVGVLYSNVEVLQYVCEMMIRRGRLLTSPKELPVSCLKVEYKSFHGLLEQPCKGGYTPFLLATRKQRLDIMQLLVKYNCDIYRKTSLLQNALHLAALTASRDTIEYLLYLDSDYNVLKNDCDYRARKPKFLDTTGHSFMHAWDLVKSGTHEKLFDQIRAGKIAVNACTHVLKNTLLHTALQCRQIFCVRELVKLGADPKVQNAEGQSAHDVLRLQKDARYEQLASRLLRGENSLSGGELSMEQIERLYFRRSSIYAQPPRSEAMESIQLDSELFYILKDIREKLILRKLFIADLYHEKDRNKDYSLTKSEFISVLQDLEVEVQEEHFRKLVASLDPKGENRISYSRLVAHFQELVKRDKHYETLNEIIEQEKAQQMEAQRRNSLDFIVMESPPSSSSPSSEAQDEA